MRVYGFNKYNFAVENIDELRSVVEQAAKKADESGSAQVICIGYDFTNWCGTFSFTDDICDDKAFMMVVPHDEDIEWEIEQGMESLMSETATQLKEEAETWFNENYPRLSGRASFADFELVDGEWRGEWDDGDRYGTVIVTTWGTFEAA